MHVRIFFGSSLIVMNVTYVDMVAKVNGYLTHDIDLALQPTDQSLNMPTYYMGTVYLCMCVCTYVCCEIASTCQVVFNCLSIN